MIQDAIMKNIKDLYKKHTQQRTSKSRIYYLCKQKGHIAKNLEFSKKNDKNDRKYLEVELLDEEECGNVRAFGKRKKATM
ncbi:27297_t:CDS:2 [Racocetra persica]|uniref:27297_t:CDS:1 n=1 Tax=Racocetra persica TaxID=160502 RepID=A0ACA9KXB0_9GLOM|nr:27297_t:CDS:2 [Racocetra persica]